MKKSSAARWIGVAVLLALVVAGAWYAFRPRKPARARHDVAVLAQALDGFARENGQFPQGTRAEICRLLRGETINGQNPRKLDYVEALPKEINGLGEFVDPWGEPYRIVVGMEARVYSCGPNRLDEQGRSDDIVGSP